MNFYEFGKVFLVTSFHYLFTGLIPLEFFASCIMLYVNKVILSSFTPSCTVSEMMPQSTLRHLKWIMQKVHSHTHTVIDSLNSDVVKDLLGQDVFLIGPSGPLKRHLALMYCVS